MKIGDRVLPKDATKDLDHVLIIDELIEDIAIVQDLDGYLFDIQISDLVMVD